MSAYFVFCWIEQPVKSTKYSTYASSFTIELAFHSHF